MPQKSILPFVILFAGFAWYAVLAWMQRRKNQGQSPEQAGAQVPVYSLVGALGLLAGVVAAGIAAYTRW